MVKMKNPPHPGRILKQEIIEPLGLSVTEIAKRLKVSRQTLSRIINCKGSITAEMAFKLSKAFETDVDFWLNLQLNYDIAQARKNVDLSEIEPIRKVS